MKLVIFNGSPRRKKSNSKLLIENFISGYQSVKVSDVPVYYLAGEKEKTEREEAFRQAEEIVIFYPLYTDCMPGIVKDFFEEIAKMDLQKDKKIGFVVQSGFPESIHSTYVEKYHKKFTTRLGAHYLGTVIKGGVEGIQIMPPSMTKKLYNSFYELGAIYANQNTFSKDIVKRLARPYKMSKSRRFVFSILSKTGLTNFYWNSNLKRMAHMKSVMRSHLCKLLSENTLTFDSTSSK